MKLRNKRTGEIYDFKITPDYDDVMSGWKIENKDFGVRYYSHLAELNAEWEDYEEPRGVKSIYFIGATVYIEMSDQKEAIEVEEKLKAWKRLKDKGLEVTEWSHGLYLDKNIVGRFRYEFPIDNKEDVEKDLDLLFGGEK